jgi:hypothetical protein
VDRRAREVVEVGRVESVEHRRVVVTEAGHATELANDVDAARRLRAVADDVPHLHVHVDAIGTQRVDDRGQRFDVRVDVTQNAYSHGASTAGDREHRGIARMTPSVIRPFATQERADSPSRQLAAIVRESTMGRLRSKRTEAFCMPGAGWNARPRHAGVQTTRKSIQERPASVHECPEPSS